MLVVTLLSTRASAFVAEPTLADLVEAADLIVTGKIVRVDDGPGSLRIAQFRIDETLKGDRTLRRISVRVSPSWTCDESEGERGEQYLLFLADHTIAPDLLPVGRMPAPRLYRFSIARDGRGQSLLEGPRDRPRAALAGSLQVPDDLHVLWRRSSWEGARRWRGAVPLKDLADEIRACPPRCRERPTRSVGDRVWLADLLTLPLRWM